MISAKRRRRAAAAQLRAPVSQEPAATSPVETPSARTNYQLKHGSTRGIVELPDGTFRWPAR